jgi:SAM-dependent methyltransferase
VFDTVVDDYVHGRPDMPLAAVQDAARELGLEPGARVLEVGAGTGALTSALVAAGFDVVALEPGAALRARAQERAPAAELVGDTFEAFEPREPFDAVFAANAFHWVDPDVSYAKAASVAGAIVLLWDMPFLADPDLHRRVQLEVMHPLGSTFPSEHDGVRAMFDSDTSEGRAELASSARFGDPWWGVYELRLEYTADRYVSLLQSMSRIAAQPPDVRARLAAGLHALLGVEPFEVIDLVYVVAARALST